ncbi:hypothetical protein ACFQGT_00605 [Natrialbaceae archaeon GCM10025810]|uniref:hypothetical protein n=1 Tax=Halovalidus salilacus TaxID=3075124 RepID=UPI003606D6E7
MTRQTDAARAVPRSSSHPASRSRCQSVRRGSADSDASTARDHLAVDEGATGAGADVIDRGRVHRPNRGNSQLAMIA